MDRAAYTDQLQSLLPRGAAWPREPGAELTKLVGVVAFELAKVDERAQNLIEEADPRYTTELLPDWERVLGLPDPCAGDVQTLEGRRERVIQKRTMRGGQSRPYLISVAAALGYAVTITEFEPTTCESACDELLYTEEWRFVYRINAPEVTIRVANCNSGCDEPLQTWGNEVLECNIRKHTHSHLHVLFGYGAT